MEDKFILRLQFGIGDNVTFSHYVLDKKYYPFNFVDTSVLKSIPEIVLTPESFDLISDVSVWNIHNYIEV